MVVLKTLNNVYAMELVPDPPVLEMDTNLYVSLRINLESISSSDLTWKVLEGSMVLSDDSEIEPRENMKCILPGSVVSKCGEFMENFNGSSVSRYMENIKNGKRMNPSCDEIWSNPAFSSSKSRNDQMKNLYSSYLFTDYRAERQSLASKARRNIGVDEERMGKKPDVMMLVEYREKIIELLYTECSRIFCSKTKKADDRMKLWEETLDGLSLDLTWNFSRIIPDVFQLHLSLIIVCYISISIHNTGHG
ncbi:6263_t:CDS:2 [Entrophospora sp. SA101]|nr:6263_t:CDS:2 [Entrophospora sp. SA101]